MLTRCYCVVNLYINGVQAGLQSAHAIAEVALACKDNTKAIQSNVWFDQWLRHDKTIIILDGGHQQNLERLYELMKAVPSLPSAKFHEAQTSLNGALTALAIVLPEYMYNPQYTHEPLAMTNSMTLSSMLPPTKVANQFKDWETGNVLHNYTLPEQTLIEAIKQLRLKGQ